MKASWSSTNGPEVGSAAAPVSVTKSSSPFGPAAIAVERHELLDDDFAQRDIGFLLGRFL